MTHKLSQTDSSPNKKLDILQLYRRTPLSPAHRKIRQSPLALSDNEDKTDFRGFVNLGVIVIICMCGQLVFENLKKYGVMLNFALPKMSLTSLRASPMLVTAIAITLLTHLHLVLENLSWSNRLWKDPILVAHTVNINLIF